MKKQRILVLAIGAALGLAACGQGEEPKHTGAEPGGAPPAEQTLSEKAAELAKEATQATSEKVEAAATAASEAAGAAMETGEALAQATVDKAKELIQQVKDYIADSDFDLAETTMEQLRKLKDSLPQALQDEIAKLEAMLKGQQEADTPASSAN